jgi:DNA-binding NtrC family response regulator
VAGVILVVDDEKSVRDFVAEALSEEGYVVSTAEDGNRAVELMASHTFDAVISNMKMPGMSGEDLYLTIREKDPDLADRLIISTGDILNEKTQRFLKRTGSLFIEKPFGIDKLLSVVGRAVGGGTTGTTADETSV